MKGSSSMQEEMNQEEMQRFLNREAERGLSGCFPGGKF